MQSGNGRQGKGMPHQLWGDEVKGQDYTTPTIDLEAWRRHHSRPTTPLGRVVIFAITLLKRVLF